MKDLIKTIDNLPWIGKLILCIPILDIVWAVYRIIKGVLADDIVKIIIGVLWIVPGSVFCWIFDLVTTILYKHPKLV